MMRFASLIFVAAVLVTRVAPVKEFLYGSEFLNAGTVYGPSPLQDCILPPKVAEGNYIGPIGELQNVCHG